MSRCDGCRQTAIDAAGESLVVEEAVAEMFDCDAQRIGRVDSPHGTADSHTDTGPHTGRGLAPGPHRPLRHARELDAFIHAALRHS